MPSMPSPSNAVGPLNVGNVVTAGLRLYRSHLKSYLKIALIATLWAIAPFLLLVVLISLAIVALMENPAILATAIGLSVLLSLAIGVYCFAKSSLNTALISRLAYGDLIQKPESVNGARQVIQSRMWGFLLIQILLNLILFASSFALSIALSLLQLLSFGVLGAIFGDSPVFSSLVMVVSIIGNLLYIGVYLWIYARFFIPEVPIAVEASTDAVTSVGRSWQLSTHSATRIVGVISVALLITLPLYVLAAVPSILAIAAMFPALSGFDAEFAAPMLIQQAVLATVAGVLLFFLISLAVLPFWQTLKAVLYYDLRSRREGIDLQFRGSQGTS